MHKEDHYKRHVKMYQTMIKAYLMDVRANFRHSAYQGTVLNMGSVSALQKDIVAQNTKNAI